MRLTGRKSRRQQAEKWLAAPDEEYAVVTGEHARLREQIRNLEGFIVEAPQIREARKRETQVTLPPIEDEVALPKPMAVIDGEDGEAEEADPQQRLGRRHLAAIRRSHRRNFLIFLMSAALVAAFLYWVSRVIE